MILGVIGIIYSDDTSTINDHQYNGWDIYACHQIGTL